ncbi:nitrilase-related carbon-nitrogen hydrolase [Corallincola spongiicola]|uniref:Glutamine-dependent NAD(+) synthetase n=1 Tax=Corallincola spongiicola TaxID=2520508 RepID=A0ABY1WM45_9GAMM|nr:nitrilase-related carbon-nitrogen hydrolase [Corallincola spongiicola]TAA42650.1 NAD(+) synthase [Corallincola spongiicola]
MKTTLRIGTASLNTVALDLQHNASLIEQAMADAARQNIELLLMPELCLSGYGCEDMFFCSDWLADVEKALITICEQVPAGLLATVGLPLRYPGGQVFNAVALIATGRILGIVCKQTLARSGIHYESRWFAPWPVGQSTEIMIGGQQVPIGDQAFSIDGVRIGFEICEDSWVAARPGRQLYQRQVDVILNPSASHFALRKHQVRRRFVQEGSRAFGVVYAYANLQGCEAGRAVYDGGNMIASNGELVAEAQRLQFDDVVVTMADVDLHANRTQRIISSQLQSDVMQIDLIEHAGILKQQANYQISGAIDSLPVLSEHDIVLRTGALGMWDWMRKTTTAGYAISLSGGADSALCASLVYYAHALAVSELAPEDYAKAMAICGFQFAVPKATEQRLTWLTETVLPQVLTTVYQGSDNSSETTSGAAAAVAGAIGAKHINWSISSLVEEYSARINGIDGAKPLNWQDDDLTLQNIQARVRSPGIWMVANRENKLLVATSNMSEASVGYTTMDGDTSGVLSPIGGISKTRVLLLNDFVEKQGVTVRPIDADEFSLTIDALGFVNRQRPTAELRPVEQTDEADLMPFPILDEIRKLGQVQYLNPQGVLNRLADGPLGQPYERQQLIDWVKRYYQLYCRNQWKRERLAVGFHIESDSADPKSYRRFPVLNSQLKRELAGLK